MKTEKIKYFLIVIVVMLFSCHQNILADNLISQANSPDGNIRFELFLDANSTMYYQVSKGSEIVISKSKLGIDTSLGDFSSGLTFNTVSSKAIDENYSLPSGKKSNYSNQCNEITASFSKSGYSMQVIARIYNEGVAYRYMLEGSGNASVISESSECNVSGINRILAQTYSKDYKNIAEEADLELLDCVKQHISLPLLVKTTNNYVLLSEAMVNGGYAASQLEINEQTQAFRYKPVGTVTSSLPLQTPWRIFFIGSLNNIIESAMPENLNTSTGITDLSWIKPGRTAWNYGGEDTSDYLSTTSIYSYIDWAAEMGWEYFTLDRGWQNNKKFTLAQVVNYGITKGIGIFIWVNQNTLASNKTDLQRTLSTWKSQGVKGLKVDFWEDDSQTMMKKYDLLLEVASEQKLMVNLHSSTKPSGLRRTWPHLLTSEAVLGNAYYATSPAVISPQHNINSAIIRSTLGATDYCPVDFADKNGRILYGTTWAHQLALSVIFESGIQHIMDAPSNIRYNISSAFLKRLPVAWDDTKCLEAEPDDFITIARKKGEDWYIASLADESRETKINLSFLTPGVTYYAHIYKDGDCPSEIQFEYRGNLNSSGEITVPLKNNGGVTMILSPSAYERPILRKYEAESADNTIPFGVATKTDKDSLCSNKQYVSDIGKGRSLTFQKIRISEAGTYAVTFYYMADATKYAYVKVNGKDESWKEYTFVSTGTETGSGLGIKTVLVDLETDIDNTIEFGNYNDYAPAIDRITVSKLGGENSGIKKIKDEKSTDIYALDNQIIIELSTPTVYKIHNTQGQLLTEGSFAGGKESIPVYDKGIYIVTINSDNMVYSKKVIIK